MIKKKVIAAAIIVIETLCILLMGAGMIKQHQVNKELIEINNGLIEANEMLLGNHSVAE